MCTEEELKTFIREEYKELDKAVLNSGITEDLYVSSLAKCFAIALDYMPKDALAVKNPKDWVDRVYLKATSKS